MTSPRKGRGQHCQDRFLPKICCIWPEKSKPNHGEKIPNCWSHGLRTSVGAMQLSERPHLLPFSKTSCNSDQWKSKWSTSEQIEEHTPRFFFWMKFPKWRPFRGRFKGGGNSNIFYFHPWVKWSILTVAYWSRMPAANWSSMLDTSPNAYGTCRRRGGILEFFQKMHREKHGTAQAWKKWNSVFYRIHGTCIFTYIYLPTWMVDFYGKCR